MSYEARVFVVGERAITTNGRPKSARRVTDPYPTFSPPVESRGLSRNHQRIDVKKPGRTHNNDCGYNKYIQIIQIYKNILKGRIEEARVDVRKAYSLVGSLTTLTTGRFISPSCVLMVITRTIWSGPG